jgi:hypothetical protein
MKDNTALCWCWRCGAEFDSSGLIDDELCPVCFTAHGPSGTSWEEYRAMVDQINAHIDDPGRRIVPLERPMNCA